MLRVVHALRGTLAAPAALRTAGVGPVKPLGFWSKKKAEVEEEPGENPEVSEPELGKPLKGNNWNFQTELSALAVRLGHDIKDLPSLIKAIKPERVQTEDVTNWEKLNSEMCVPSRLAVLGKATLQFYVQEYLHYSYPVMTGAMLDDVAQSLLNVDTLSELSNYMGVTDVVRVRKDSAFWSNPAEIAAIFCATVGAVYQDAGAKAARKIVHNLVVSQLAGKDLEVVVKLEHPRLMLTSILKAQKRTRPESRLISESGRATHFPSFRVGVFSGNDLLGEGTGTSLRRAEKEAMLTALRSYFMKEVSVTSLPSDMDDYQGEEELREEMQQNLTAKEQELEEASNQ